MENGTGLFGDDSATQSAIIVPSPANDGIYYIFTVGALGGPLNYSVVDIRQSNTFGKVIKKNTELLNLSTERITAVRHANGKDIWVVGHEWKSDKFHSWLITGTGVIEKGIISAVGTVQEGDEGASAGYMKVSPDGSTVAYATNQDDNYIEIFDFNNVNGSVSNTRLLTGIGGDAGPYGLEFSPDSKILYFAENSSAYPGNLYQIKLPAETGSIAGKAVSLVALKEIGALQLGPDGRIYVAQYKSHFLHVRDKPNVPGNNADFMLNTIPLGDKQSTFGLPTFIQSFFNKLSFSYLGNCISTPVHFTLQSNIQGKQKILWNFGDPASGTNNLSSIDNPDHLFSRKGTYEVIVTDESDGEPSTYKQSIQINAVPSVDLGKDTTLFYGQTLLLKAGGPKLIYKWNDGTVDSTLLVVAPGQYNVNVSNGACSGSGSIKVNFDQVIDVHLAQDTVICEGQTLVLDVSTPGAKYSWSDGTHLNFLNVSKPGNYWVDITNAYRNRVKRYAVDVRLMTFNDIKIKGDTLLCEAGNVTLTASGALDNQYYNWYDEHHVNLSNKNSRIGIYVDKTTTYYGAVTNGICEGDQEKITIHVDKPKAVILNKDTTINLGDSFLLSGKGGMAYRWFPATYLTSADQATTLCKPTQDISYELMVTNRNGCMANDTINIRVRRDIIIPNVFTPNGDNQNDTWVIKNIELFKNSIKIYNRYGIIVFATTNYINNWQGTNNGSPLPAGTYYYLIDTFDNQRHAGFVSILR